MDLLLSVLQMGKLRTNSRILHATFTQLCDLPNEVNSLLSVLSELYVRLPVLVELLKILWNSADTFDNS